MDAPSPRIAGVIIRDNDVLLMHRIKRGREFYVFPGGTIEFGETFEETLKREILEETSLAVEKHEALGCWDSEFEGKKSTACYFLVVGCTGNAALGNGPEIHAQTADNAYRLVWLPLGRALASPLLVPPGVGARIAEKLRERGYSF